MIRRSLKRVVPAFAVVGVTALSLVGFAQGPPATTPPDPCTLGLTPPGNANGLDRRCIAEGGGSGVARGDFNGDGFGDLAVGVPYEDLPSGQDAGAVNVIYGSANGLTATGSQMIHQDSTGVPDVGEPNDHFGMALASGDFDGDGFSDLAIGVPDEDGTRADAGAVQVFRGGAAALVYWQTLSDSALLTRSIDEARFGASLAWGDFNGDGMGDLAVGAPNYRSSLVAGYPDDEGFVYVYFGSISGLAPGANLFQDYGFDDGESFDHFGSVLAAGDHDGDGFDDLAIGVPNEDVGFLGVDEGMVHLVFGAEYGFRRPSGDPAARPIVRTFTQSSFGAPLQNNAQFGRALAMGNTTNAAAGDELYIGVPLYDAGSNFRDSGIVYELRSTGPGSSLTFVFSSSSTNGASEAGARFGWALALGDFDGNGFKDLAVGVPGEDVGSAIDAGVVHVIPNSAFGGLNKGGTQVWGQGSSIVPDTLESGDTFGASLSAWNFGRTGQADLAIGVPYEDFTVNGVTRTNAGLIDVLYGSSTGLGGPVQAFSQATPGIAGSFESNDLFGFALY